MRKITFLLLALLIQFSMSMKAEVVFEGVHEVGSWNAKQLPVASYPVLAKAGLGDVIAVTIEDSSDGRITLQDMSWSGFADEYNCANGIHYFVLSESNATSIAANGLIVTGENYTLTKVELLYKNNLWEGTVNDNTGWTQSEFLDNSLFSNLTEGSLLGMSISAINDGESWHQFALRADYTNMLGKSASEAGTYLFTLTAENASDLKEKNIDITAQYLCVSALTTYTDTKEEEYNPVVWTGETVFGSTWSVYETIAASAFVQAQEGYLLRVKFKDLKAGACLQLSDNSWTLLSGTDDAPSISGVYHQYTITNEMLAELQEGGMIVSGTNFTLTAIEVLDPTTLKPLTLSVPTTGNWVYTSAPSFTIHVENPYDEAVTANAVVSIATDKLTFVTTIKKSVEVSANGSEDIVLTLDEALYAGFYKATCTVNDDLARAFFFAQEPTAIASATDKQDDFDSFWQTALEQLEGIDMNARLTEITSKSTEKRKVYLVELQSVPDGTSGTPITIRGYYCEPTDGQKHPVIMHYLGYDSGYRPSGESATPYCPSGDANPNYAEFYLSTRGQSINNRPAADRDDDIEEDFNNTYGDWFAFNFGNKDSYYYRGAYMDCVRAIDFMASRETSDMDNLYAEGQSQGGAFTYAAAALSGYTFSAIAPAIPFMGDFPNYFEIVNWPASVARDNQGDMNDAEMYAFLSYFDTKNLATAITCPVITSIGLQDNICPPHTNIIPYNNVQTAEADKQIVYNPELGHQVNDEWYTTYNNFFSTYAVSSEDAETIWEGTETIDETWTTYKALTYDDRAGLANARMTDIIRITLTTAAENAQIQLSNPNKGWNKYSDEAGADLTYSNAAQTFEYTISSAAVLEDIQLTGIIITGKNYNLTKVELVKPEGRYDAAAITIGEDGIATYSSSKNLDLSGTGLKAYYASEINTGIVTLTPVTTIWGYQGYIIRGKAGIYEASVTDNATYPSTNYLKATSDYNATVTASTQNTFHYIFAKDETKGVGFYRLSTDKTLAAHKAYLETSIDITPAEGTRLALVFEGEATGISDTTRPNQVSGSESHCIYDLQGRRVQNPSKGIYIIRGKKVVMK